MAIYLNNSKLEIRLINIYNFSSKLEKSCKTSFMWSLISYDPNIGPIKNDLVYDFKLSMTSRNGLIT